MRLILGSASPRRAELLAQLGVVADEVRAPDIDETPHKRELPRAYCIRMARQKLDVIDAAEGDIVLCADTTVALGRDMLGKPRDAAHAAEFLLRLAGRRHTVITAIALKTQTRTWERVVVSVVRMKRLSDDELNAYLASGDWQGKAGGYAIQGPAGAFIPWIQGSYSGVMGLPLAETATLLCAAGYPLYRGGE